MSTQFHIKMNDKQNIRINLLKIKNIYEEAFILKSSHPLHICYKNLLHPMSYSWFLTSVLVSGSTPKLLSSFIKLHYCGSCWLYVLIISFSIRKVFKAFSQNIITILMLVLDISMFSSLYKGWIKDKYLLYLLLVRILSIPMSRGRFHLLYEAHPENLC